MVVGVWGWVFNLNYAYIKLQKTNSIDRRFTCLQAYVAGTSILHVASDLPGLRCLQVHAYAFNG